MQSFPQPLSVEEENEAIERWEQGDREARNILIERNLRLVAYLVKKYSNSDHSVDDLISIGTIGLIKAVDTCGDYCVDTKEKLVEILYFRHFAKHFTFTSEGKNSRNKHLKNYFDVSVVIDIGCGNTNEK